MSASANLAARILQHRSGAGSDFGFRHGLKHLVWAERGADILNCIAPEKRLKRWHRQWKFDLIERDNPEWQDLLDRLT